MMSKGVEWEYRVPDRASSKGRAIRQVEILSNKLLTTAFEASLESVAVTLQAKRRQQDNRDSLLSTEIPKSPEGRHRGLDGRQHMYLSLW